MSGYYLVICRVSSTDHIYHRAAKLRGDKFDRSMATTELILGTPILGMAIQVTTATAVSHAFPWCVRLSSNIPGFVSVDLIGENNQDILEYIIIALLTTHFLCRKWYP